MNNSVRASLVVLGVAFICGAAFAQSQFGQSPGARPGMHTNRSIYNNRFLRQFPANRLFINPGLSSFWYRQSDGASFYTPTTPPIDPKDGNAEPNQMGEMFFSEFGNDQTATGLTPNDAFRSAQGCIDAWFGRYYMDGFQPVCRPVNTRGSAGTLFHGFIQITGPMGGRQNAGGGNMTIWGTCPLTGSPFNEQVGRVNGVDDIRLRAPGPTTIPGSPPAIQPHTLFSAILGAHLQVSCLTAGADSTIFSVQQFSHLFIATNVKTMIGAGGSTISIIDADNFGMALIWNLTVATGASQFFAKAANNSRVSFLEGNVFGDPKTPPIAPPTFNTVFFATNNSTISGTPGQFQCVRPDSSLGACNASPPNTNVSSVARCSVLNNSTVDANGASASLPGNGICAAGNNGVAN